MPIVVTVLAVRAGLNDARTGQPAFLWGILAFPAKRRSRLLAAWKDIGKIVVVALVLDTAYQLLVLRAFYVVQALIVAAACAILPYVLCRGPITRLASGHYRRQVKSNNATAVNSTDKAIAPHEERTP